MSDWLDERHAEHTAKVKTWKLEKGDFIQQTWTASGVWYEIKDVGDNYVIIYDSRRTNGTDWVFFYQIRNHTKSIYKEGLILVEIQEGRFGGKTVKPLMQLPLRLHK